MLRNLRQLRSDVSSVMERSSQSRRTVQPLYVNQATDVEGPTPTRKDTVQVRSYAIDNIEDPNRYSDEYDLEGIRSHRHRRAQGRRGRRKHKGHPCGAKDIRCFACEEESSDSPDTDKSDSSFDEEEYRGRARSASSFYRRGTRYRKLKELRLNNPCFTEALSYRTYF